MISLDLHTNAPPSAVLDALRASGGEWQQSRIPPELRQHGLNAVEIRVRGSLCTLTTRRRWYGPDHAWPLRAVVEVLPDGAGARIRVRVRHIVPALWGPFLGMGLVTLIGVLVVGPAALALLALPLIGIGTAQLLTRAASFAPTRRADAEANYLVASIECAVMLAETMATSHTPVS